MHGRANLSQGTQIVLEALKLAKVQVPALKCIMFNSFIEGIDANNANEFKKTVSALGVTEIVDLRKGVPMQAMPAILQGCDAGLIAYGRKLGADSLPNRLFAYMAVGMPVIAPVYSPEINRIPQTEKCGIAVDFENPASVAEAIIHLSQEAQECREMGQRAREAFLKRHNWEVEVQPVIEQIRSWYNI